MKTFEHIFMILLRLGIFISVLKVFFQFVPELLHGIYRTVLTWKDQNLGRKVEVIYMDEPCNAC